MIMKEIRYPYRFKTEKEFIESFGSEWRNRVMYTFPSCMNYLLGTDYPYELSDREFERDYINDVSGYSISSGMLVTKRKRPSYEPRKIIRDI